MKFRSLLLVLFIGISISLSAQDATEIYNTGVDFYKNGEYKEAVKHFEVAANLDHSMAQVSLGRCYKLGEGVYQNDRLAFEWFSKASRQDNPIAWVHLGACYADGIFVAQDYQKAVSWFRKAADRNQEVGQAFLAVCYENGLGVAKNLSQADYWNKKARENGYDPNKKWSERIKKEKTTTTDYYDDYDYDVSYLLWWMFPFFL